MFIDWSIVDRSSNIHHDSVEWLRSQILSDQGLLTWERFLKSHAAITRYLDVQLQRDHNMTLSDYGVILQLFHAKDGVRMSDLARQAMLTPSGITRLVKGLERDGIVDRINCQSDSRVTWITLTPQGRSSFSKIRKAHLDDVKRLFIDRYSQDELEQLLMLLDRLPSSSDGCSCSS